MMPLDAIEMTVCHACRRNGVEAIYRLFSSFTFSWSLHSLLRGLVTQRHLISAISYACGLLKLAVLHSLGT